MQRPNASHIKVAFIGAGHWHLGLYLEPLKALDGVLLAGLHAEGDAVAAALAERHGVPGFAGRDTMLDAVAPGFVFLLGRHATMAADAMALIERGIPFAVEKPAGLTAAEVEKLARAAEARGVFVDIPFVIRESAFAALVRDRVPPGELRHMSFRFFAGPATRYLRNGCPWMLDPAQAGGGALLNLGVHFLDLIRLFSGVDRPRVVAASRGACRWGHGVEDYACVTVEAGGALATVETGYLFPGPTSTFDLSYSIAGTKAYVVVPDDGTAVVIGCDADGFETCRQTHAMATTNVANYPLFVRNTIDRWRTGRPPLAGLRDMAAVFDMVAASYAMAPLDDKGQGSAITGNRRRS